MACSEMFGMIAGHLNEFTKLKLNENLWFI